MGSEMLFVNFNQDFTCLSVGSRHGYKIYNSEPFGKYFMKRMSLCVGAGANGSGWSDRDLRDVVSDEFSCFGRDWG